MSNVPVSSQRQTAIENSFAFKARQLVLGVSLNAYQNTPSGLVGEIQTINESLQKIRQQCDDAVSAVVEAVNVCSGGDVLNIETTIEAVKIQKLPLIRIIAEWYAAATDIAKRHIEALSPIPARLSGEAEKVVAKVKEELEGIGSGLMSMSANAEHATDTAERQFDFIARHNLKARAAITLAQQAKTEYEAAVEKSDQIASKLEAVTKLGRTIATAAVANAV